MSAADYHRAGAEQMKADRQAAERIEKQLEEKLSAGLLESKKGG
jgi:hypothetical protein